MLVVDFLTDDRRTIADCRLWTTDCRVPCAYFAALYDLK